jgi:5-methylthioadenosine/S-adenosylhomocysteine deaminase
MLTVYQPELLWHQDKFARGMSLVVDSELGRIAAVGLSGDILREFPQAQQVLWPKRAVVPGTINTHTHSFQHLLRGVAVDQPFLVWRDQALYRLTPYLDADAIYLGATLAFSEMLRHGVTTVADFFYVHNHGLDNDMAVVQAARDVGIRLVLARTFYDWEGAPAAYLERPEEAEERTRELARRFLGDPMVYVHPAPHSVHGASDAMIQRAWALAMDLGSPCHIHVSEEPFEVEQCRARTGHTPVRHLQQLGVMGPALIAVHLTWAEPEDIDILGKAHANLAYCPSSNMFLADGVTPLQDLQRSGVTAGLGTDGGCSNNRASIFEEMRMAALLQKVKNLDATVLSHRTVWEMGTTNGAAMLGIDAGLLEPGNLADFSALNLIHPSLLPWTADTLLANIVYAMDPEAITDVVVGGREVVQGGRVAGVNPAELADRLGSWSEKLVRAGPAD